MSRKNAVTLLALVLFGAWFVVLGPAPIGGPATYVVIDGTSMEPNLVDGDLAIVRRSDSYTTGDVIAFRIPNGDSSGLVIHRIVGGTAEDGFQTQGDNRGEPDPWRPRPHDIAGSVWFTMSGAGGYLARLRDPMLIAPLAAGLTVFLVLLGGGSAAPAQPRPDTTSAIGRLRRFLHIGRARP